MVWSNNLLFGQTSNIIELEKIETAKDIKKLFYFTPDQDISDADIVSGKYDQSFKPADVIMLNLGRQKSSWVKINLHSPYKKQMNYVIGYHFTSCRVLYFNQSLSTPLVNKITPGTPFRDRVVPNRTHVMELPLNPGVNSIYINQKCTLNTIFFLKIWDKKSFYESQANDWIAHGIGLGVVLAMILYNFFIFLMVRKRIYFLYVCYISSFFVYFIFSSHIGDFNFSPEVLTHSYMWSLFFKVIMNIFLNQFSLQYLDLVNHKIINRIFKVINILFVSVFALSIIHAKPYFTMSTILQSVNIFIVIGLGIYLTFKRVRIAYLFTLAWFFPAFCFFTLVSLSVFKTDLLIPLYLHPDWSGIVLELLLMGFAVGDKIRLQEKADKETIQRDQRIIKSQFDEISILNKELDKKVQLRTQELRLKTQEIESIFENVSVGLFTIDENQIIHEPYSKHLIDILENDNIEEKSIYEILIDKSNIRPDEKGLIRQALGCVGMGDLTFFINNHFLPKNLVINPDTEKKKNLNLTWDVIVDSEKTVQKILISVHDSTELSALREKTKEHEVELELISEILQLGTTKAVDQLSRFKETMASSTREYVPARHNDTMRTLHTLKGSSRLYGFKKLSDMVHVVEQNLINAERDSLHKDGYIDQLTLVENQLESYLAAASKLGTDSREKELTTFIDFVQSEISSSINRGLLTTEMSDFFSQMVNDFMENHFSLKEIIYDLSKTIGGICIEMKKSPAKVSIVGENFQIPERMKDIVEDSLSHILRNSIAHGIEDDEERVSKGKNKFGEITIEIHNNNNKEAAIKITDDGRGLNLEALKLKGLTQGIIDKDTDDIGIANVMFSFGVSTAKETNDIAGRGVGMDAVKDMVQKASGDVTIDLGEKSGPYCQFSIGLVLPF